MVKKTERRVSRVKKGAERFRNEFRKQSITAITAAFGFLIALSWREPISDLIKKIVEDFGLSESLIYYKFVSALLITFLGVISLIILSKWAVEK